MEGAAEYDLEQAEGCTEQSWVVANRFDEERNSARPDTNLKLGHGHGYCRYSEGITRDYLEAAVRGSPCPDTAFDFVMDALACLE